MISMSSQIDTLLLSLLPGRQLATSQRTKVRTGYDTEGWAPILFATAVNSYLAGKT
jgi:hypothetical protein